MSYLNQQMIGRLRRLSTVRANPTAKGGEFRPLHSHPRLFTNITIEKENTVSNKTAPISGHYTPVTAPSAKVTGQKVAHVSGHYVPVTPPSKKV